MTTEPDAAAEKYDLEGLSKSLTGWDEIAIQQMFRSSIEELSGTVQARALLFVALRRAGGKDGPTFKQVMDMTIVDVEARFEITEEMRAAAEQGKAGRLAGTGSTPTS